MTATKRTTKVFYYKIIYNKEQLIAIQLMIFFSFNSDMDVDGDNSAHDTLVIDEDARSEHGVPMEDLPIEDQETVDEDDPELEEIRARRAHKTRRDASRDKALLLEQQLMEEAQRAMDEEGNIIHFIIDLCYNK